MATITSSATLDLESDTIETVQETDVKLVVHATVANNEALTIVHGKDPEFVRSVEVINLANGQKVLEPAASGTNTGVTISRFDSTLDVPAMSPTKTLVTFGSAAAGTYKIVIRF